MAMRFPFQIDGRGCTATAPSSDDGYIRDLMEQVLMTAPGERVNRPEFGCGVLGLVFSPGGDVMAAALRASVQASLQRWLVDLVQIQTVQIEVKDAMVAVTVQYVVLRSQEAQVASFTSGAGSALSSEGEATT